MPKVKPKKLAQLEAEMNELEEKYKKFMLEEAFVYQEWNDLILKNSTEETVTVNLPIVKARFEAKAKGLHEKYLAAAKLFNEKQIEYDQVATRLTEAKRNLDLLQSPNFDKSDFSGDFLKRVENLSKQTISELA